MIDTEPPVPRALRAVRREDVLLALGYPAMMWLLTSVNNDPGWSLFPPALSAWWPVVAAAGSVAVLFRRGATHTMACVTGGAALVLLLTGQTSSLFLLWETIFSLVLFAGDRVSRSTEIAALTLTAAATLTVLAATADLGAAVLTALIAGMSLLLPAEWAGNLRKERRLSAAEATRALAAEEAIVHHAAMESARHELAIASERQRMAHELHDVLSARLSAIALQSGAALRTGNRDMAADVLAHVRRESVAGLDELASMIRLLGSGESEEATGFIEDLDSLVAAHAASGTVITFSSTFADTGSIPWAQQTATYRVVAESLVNALRHAPGSGIAVVLQGGPEGGWLRVLITNEAPPAAPAATMASQEQGTGTGLRSLRLRVEQLGGTLRAGRHDGGWQVSVQLPIPSNPAISAIPDSSLASGPGALA